MRYKKSETGCAAPHRASQRSRIHIGIESDRHTKSPAFIGLTKDGKGWDYFTDVWHPMIRRNTAPTNANHNMDVIYSNVDWLYEAHR